KNLHPAGSLLRRLRRPLALGHPVYDQRPVVALRRPTHHRVPASDEAEGPNVFNREAIFSCAIGLAATMLVACAVPNPHVGQNATVQFGVVRSAEPVTLNSAAAEGALIGGTLGLVAGRGQRSSARNAIVGAALGGAATAAAEGERQGMAYTVDILDGSSMRIVTDQREIQ